MEEQLYEHLRQCAVRIGFPGGHGTGFFVAPGLILTCAHVVTAAQPSTSSIEVFRDGQLYPAQIRQYVPDSDLALLQVGFTEHPWADIDEEVLPFDPLYCFGYPDIHSAGDPVTFMFEGKAGEKGEQLKFKSGQVRPGMSGAPLLNVRTGYVCGVIQLTRDKNNDLGGRAIPISAVFRAFPELIAGQRYTITNELKTYLEKLCTRLTEVPPYYPDGFELSRIRQKVRVSKQRLLSHTQEAHIRSSKRSLIYVREDEERYQEEVESIYLRRGREMLEDQQEGSASTEEPVVVEWDKIRKQVKRAVILGDPGFGKSWLLQYEGYLVAQEQLAEFQREGVAQDTVLLPITLPLTTLGEELRATDQEMDEVILRILRREYRLSDRLLRWVKRRIASPQCLLLLDALDEVAVDKREAVHKALKHLSDNAQCRILLTSRIVGYQGAPFLQEDGKRPLELELVAFDREQVSGFLEGWFAANKERKKQLEEKLRREPVLRSFARIPLLLTFLCVISSGNREIPTRRAKLYDTVLRLLLEGPWRAPGLQEQDEGRLEHKLLLLKRMAWHFATYNQLWHDLLPAKDLVGIIDDFPWKSDLERTAEAKHHQSLLWELSDRDGVLVKAGAPSSDMARSQVPYQFLHRTFHEYLTASYLADRQRDEWVQVVKSHCWFDPNWEEVIVLLAGCLADPQVLLEALMEEPYDAFGAMSLLAGRCLGEADKDETAHGLDETMLAELAEPILARLRLLLYSASDVNRDQAARVLVQIGKPAVAELLDALRRIEASFNKKFPVFPRWHKLRIGLYKTAIWALGQIGDPRAVEPLLTILGDKSKYPIAQGVIEALGNIGDPRAVDALLTWLGPRGENVRTALSEAFGRIADQDTVEKLLAALHENDRVKGEGAAEALGRCGDVAIEGLIEEIHNPVQWPSSSRLQALKALGVIGGPRTVDVLLEVFQRDHDEYARIEAAEALGQIGDPRAVEPLLRALFSGGSWMRSEVTKALGQIGDRRVVEPLLTIAWEELKKERSSNYTLLTEAVKVLGQIGDPRAAAVLLNILRHIRGKEVYSDGEELRRTIVEVLGKIGGAQAAEDILIELQDLRGPDFELHMLMRPFALKALEEIGKPAVPGLLDILERYQLPELQVHIISVLGSIGDPRAIEPLVDILVSKDATRTMHEAAAEALERIGGWQVTERIQNLLRNNKAIRDVQIVAMGALSRDSQAMQTWLQALRKNRGWFIVDAPGQVLDKLIREAPPETLCTYLLQAWKRWPLDRLLRIIARPPIKAGEWGWHQGRMSVLPPSAVKLYLYWLFLQLAPRLRETSGEKWVEWRRRLLKPANYTVSQGLWWLVWEKGQARK